MKKHLIFGITLLSILFISCNVKKYSEKETIEYVNNIPDEEFVKSNSSSKFSYIQNTTHGKTSVKVKNFSGIEKLMEFSGKNVEQIKVSAKVPQGCLRVIVCDSKEILYEFDLTKSQDVFTLPDTSKYYIKAAGKNTSYNLQIELEKSYINNDPQFNLNTFTL